MGCFAIDRLCVCELAGTARWAKAWLVAPRSVCGVSAGAICGLRGIVVVVSGVLAGDLRSIHFAEHRSATGFGVESASATSRFGDSSSPALCGLCVHGGGFCASDSRHAGRISRCGLAAVGEFGDALGGDWLGLSHFGDRVGVLVGLPRAWLGRILVLGPGGKYRPDAVAGVDRIYAFVDCIAQIDLWVCRMDGTAGFAGIPALFGGAVFGAIGAVDLGTRFCR